MPSCHSTNDICADLISEGAMEDGTIVITDHQTRGHGQGANHWESEKGANLTLSLVLNTSFLQVHKQFYLNMVTCLAISDLLKEFLDGGIYIKWPNDIYYKNRKASGILIQNILRGVRLEKSIVGMGINVNQNKFNTKNATSMNIVTGRWYNLQDVLNRLIQIFEMHYTDLRNGLYGKLKGPYMNRLMWFNEEHRFRSGGEFSGTIVDVNEYGRLQISTREGVRAFNFKEVEFVA